MKQILLLTILTISAFANAQNTNPQGDFKFGVHSGINIANLTETDEDDSRYGLNVGAYALFEIENSNFAIRSGVNYSQQGAKTSGETMVGDIITDFEATVKLDYLQIPLLAQYNFGNFYSVYLGPQVGFVVSDEAEIESNYLGTLSEEIDNEQTATLSGIVGLQAFLYNGLFTRVQYDLGLTQVYRDQSFIVNGQTQLAESDIKHSVFTFTVGYQF